MGYPLFATPMETIKKKNEKSNIVAYKDEIK
jgi:hypothetical protein